MPDRPDATERLLRLTRRRLFLVTFGLVATLVVGIGAATAVAGLTALDADVDNALATTVDAAAAHVPSQSSGEGETEDVQPASADTFVLYLDRSGAVVADPSRIQLIGLPDAAAVAAVQVGASRDWRTIVANGRPIRLLTQPVTFAGGASGIAYVQGGFVLTLHDAQARSIVGTILGAGAAGLLAAAAVTALVTRRALAPIRRSIDAQRRFVADASHELRTPVSIIRADAEVLQREGHLDAAGLPLAADIVDETTRLGRLVGDLLTLASSEAQGLALHLERLDLGSLAGETARRLEPLAAAHDVTIASTGAALRGAGASAALVDGDRERLVQLLVILLDNAIGHAPAGTTVEVAATATGPSVELAVRDHGPGVPPADRERIFEPFTRSATARRDRARGSGLGLAIASAIVAAHRGAIRAEEAPGGGARFVVTLPAVG